MLAVKSCPTCGHYQVSCTCGLSWRERILGIQIDVRALGTRTKQNYVDRESLRQVVGDDAEDRYWDETDGMGAMHRQPDGSFVHTDFRGETKVATDEVLAEFIGHEEAADVV